ncbi:MAG TPA: TonB-dependent receptor [Steroidobacteraceae bacterium]|jgi:outer membrane receptor protein involved in Fe transport
MRQKKPAHTAAGQILPAISGVSAAVFFALYGAPQPAAAQQADTLQEITVTATRRELTLEAVPYSLSVVSSDDIERSGATDLASLAKQVPGLSMFDFGSRLSAATTPIIRGLNGTGESVTRPFRTFEQSPVGVYIGNSPIQGYFQLDDLSRIEVLRGPQGTLYGAGALGGAIRIIPTSPKIGEFSASLDASGGNLAHSSGHPYTVGSTVNIPVGDTVAVRVTGKYAYEPGFVDVYGLVKRTGSQFYGPPVLADPSDPVNSEAIYSGKKDWNDQNTFTGRASLLWKPTEKFSAELAFIYSSLNGDGGPETNTAYKGGAYYIDPRITFPSGGPYQDFASFNQPYWRRTSLASLDLSYDAGFATLSTTSSYYKTQGMTQDEGTYGVGGYPYGNAYYSGNPLNPRFVYGQWFTDSAHTFTQEVRLVSNTGPGKLLDWVVGVYYEKQTTIGNWYTSTPGSYERSVAEGCTAPFSGGGVFPNCLLSVGPNDTPFTQFDTQNFEDKSVFGELTWHVFDKLSVTFGGRHFQQQFTDAQSYDDYTFYTFIPATPHNAPASKNTWKVNPSYEWMDHQFLYATWSQGFRRGGANSVPLTGIFQESPLLATYAPDSVNNYEVGMKGRFSNGFSYTVALFDMRWDKPQISASLPSGNLAVYNGKTAQSDGVEIEISGPLFLPGLTYMVGGAYTDARLTSSFSYPANNGAGTGTIVPNEVVGTAGEQMPGSPKTALSGSLVYKRALAPTYDWDISLNGTYSSVVPLYLSSTQAQYKTPPYGLLNLDTNVRHNGWRLGAYVKNLADRRVDMVPAVLNPFYLDPTLLTTELINPPREIGLRVGYQYK